MKLEESDRRILALLGTEPRSVDDLAADLDVSPADLGERLADLADNGLVDGREGGRYERTESGRRVLTTSPTSAPHGSVDTPDDVERALDESDLGPDEAEAVRDAYTYLRYWGETTREEIVDAIYSEAPAGHDTPEEWWEGLRDVLADLPDVTAPTAEGEPWRYAGTPEAAEPATDGRRVLSRDHPVYGDVRHALDSLDLSEPEREAAGAAFEFLSRREEATESELNDAVYPDHRAGYDSSEAWWTGFARDVLRALPGVRRTDEGTWRYDATDHGREE